MRVLWPLIWVSMYEPGKYEGKLGKYEGKLGKYEG